MTYRFIKDLIAYNIKFGSGFEKELKTILGLSNLPKQELLELKEKTFVKQFQNAFQNSKFYNNLYQSHGLSIHSVKSLSDANKLPIINKTIVKENALAILTRPRFTVFKAYSSGTTGTPLRVYRNFSSTIKEYAYGHFFQQMHGYQLGDPVVSLRGVLDRNTLSYFDKSNNVLYISSFHLGTDKLAEIHKMITDFQPKVIKAYPSSMHILATELYKANLELNIPLAFTSSEVLHDFQREIIEKVFHTKIFDWYGNAEQTVAFGQFADSYYHEFPLYSHTEFEDNHMITTGFINRVFPLIRYKVDDVIQLAPTSNGTCVVQKIEGRDDDYVILKNGQQIGRLDLAFKKVNRLLAAQIIQNVVGEIKVNLIPDKGFTVLDNTQLEQNLRALLGNDCSIKFEKIETQELIRSSKGKFSLVVSQIEKI
ncbi:hypothetical protein BZG02_10080 [Labilibaculum filiforme]|uniref:AMP-dependent synthetase/ligase domain-containing protein n=1 Tax=Labilibaculum filiforme TaxID=1940526 RepID=A0A2N3HYH9_9BACT|nr:phenylacetate--CoA ligase family protein [Labilibaculum filiforme]PKQ63104.1 hypothetical protein BZG02_10080 [Labilibaculum filiforme]